MASNGEVWVYAEHDWNKLQDIGIELLSKGRELADELGVKLASVIIGDKVTRHATILFEHGADKVYACEGSKLDNYDTAKYAKVLTDLTGQYKPQVVLFGASARGRDLAPRVASKLRVGLTADCTDLQIGDFKAPDGTEYKKILYQIRPAFGGNIIATIVNPNTRPQMATVREGVMPPPPSKKGKKGEIVKAIIKMQNLPNLTSILHREKTEKKVNLKASRIIVSGGYGVGSKENFAIIRNLASVLGAEVGASRAAVDAGFIEKDHQVGQTGTTVRPALYIACGISGSVQHRAGMDQSAKIVAINNDPEAPIFSIAHYGIIGDLNEVIPMLIEDIKKRRVE
ncbi:MAG: electron transfer flavoprotein subunit alpha/FixB family protein [Spirochaetota bacterium]|nr:MAG: electron transfer flavoprotein subunit alpha/FixB family protein [Spirochaetota bacterium]